jgi:ketosteroid isomerase-like protein
MRTPLLVATLAFVIVTALPATAPGQAKATPAAGPEKVVGCFVEALNTADLDRLLACFEEDATVFFPLSELPLRLEDKGQIAKAFGAFFQTLRRQSPGPRFMNLVPSEVKVQPLGDAALVTFHFLGGPMVSRRTVVLRRHGEEWRIVHLHASNLQMPVQQAPAPGK